MDSRSPGDKGKQKADQNSDNSSKINIPAVRMELSEEGRTANLRSLGMCFLVQLEKESRLAQGLGDFNCYVIASNLSMKAFLEGLAKAKLKLETSKLEVPVRIQLIVMFRTEKQPHFSAVDFQLSKNNSECILLEAAGSAPGLGTMFFLENFKDKNDEFFFKTIYLPGEGDQLQKDTQFCSFFTLDHAMQISLLEDIYEKLSHKKGKEQSVDIPWMEVPAFIVRNAQSFKWIEEYRKNYLEKHPDEIEAFEEYINAHSVKKIGKDGQEIIGEDGKVAMINAGAMQLSKALQANALNVLSQIDEKDLQTKLAAPDFDFTDLVEKHITQANEKFISMLSTILHNETYWKESHFFSDKTPTGVKEMRNAIDNREDKSSDAVLNQLEKISEKHSKEREGLFSTFKTMAHGRSSIYSFYKNVRDALNGDAAAKLSLETLADSLESKKKTLGSDEASSSQNQNNISSRNP